MAQESIDFKQLLEQRTRELQASEARFRNVIARNADGIIIVDKHGLVRFVNPAAESLFDRKAEELQDALFGFPLVAGETTEIDILRRGGDVCVAEMRMVETEWEGEVAYLASLRDITERKRNEEIMRLLESAIEQANEAIIITSANPTHSGPEIIFANRAFTMLTGFEPEEVIGKSPLILQGPKTDPAVIEELRGCLKEGRVFYGETINYRKDGSEFFLEWHVAPIRSEHGDVKHYVAIQRDITERKRAEEERAKLIREQAARAEAEAAQRRFAFLAEASALLATSLNYETTMASVARLAVPHLADWCVVDMLEENGRVRRLAAAHVDIDKVELIWEMERRYPTDTTTSTYGPAKVLRTGQLEMLPEIPDTLLTAMAHDQDHIELLRKVGFASYICVPLLARGRTLGAMMFVLGNRKNPTGRLRLRRYEQDDLVLAEDLARRAALAVDNARLYREAQTASRLKDEFLATVSHELRTPLTSMLGWSRMLRSGKIDSTTQLRALEVIERNAKAQAQIIDDLLDVSRIITGKLVLDLRPVELANIIESAIDTVRPTAEVKGIKLETVLLPGVGSITGDSDRLQQIVWNLVSNAIKFTPPGGQVCIRLERVDTNAEITVSDTGQGIKAEFLPHIFERFSQADGSITRTHGGLGLGLAIVRHLVEAHGGKVEADSKGEGYGAIFKVKLPLTTVRLDLSSIEALDRMELTSEIEEIAQEVPKLDGIKVLVVDDEADAREMLTAILVDAGAMVRIAASAAEAMEAISQWQPDVLVSDIGMPGEDGYELIRKVRALAAREGGRMPAVALTAYARSEDRRRTLLAGFQMHVPKPVEPVELIAVVASLASNIKRPNPTPSRSCD